MQLTDCRRQCKPLFRPPSLSSWPKIAFALVQRDRAYAEIEVASPLAGALPPAETAQIRCSLALYFGELVGRAMTSKLPAPACSIEAMAGNGRCADICAPRRVRAVLDTNALLQSVGLKSRFRPIYNALLAGDYELVVGTSASRSRIRRSKVGPAPRPPYLTATPRWPSLLLLNNLVRQRISYDFRLIATTRRRQVRQCLIAGQAGLFGD
jgi:hypothetical protein